jgi:hypothetical protein
MNGGLEMASRYESLEAWQIADELGREVIALTETGPAAKDFAFRDEIRDAVTSRTRYQVPDVAARQVERSG